MSVRLAQVFSVFGRYSPSKASLYLKRIGSNTAEYFDVTSGIVIDSSNFSHLEQKRNKLTLDDRDTNGTGNGFMVMDPTLDLEYTDIDDFPILSYPIKADAELAMTLWMRVKSSETSVVMDDMIDGETVHSLSQTVTANTWTWIQTPVVLPDSLEHVLGVRIREKGNAIDKLYLTTGTAPSGSGPAYSASPYVTIHVLVYDTNSSMVPTDPLFVYDWKTTLSEVLRDDFYNFDISVLDTRRNPDYSSSCALVLTATGVKKTNTILWEMVPSDEYDAFPSAIKV